MYIYIYIYIYIAHSYLFIHRPGSARQGGRCAAGSTWVLIWYSIHACIHIYPMSVFLLCGSPWGPVCSVWAPCGALPSGGLPLFGVPPPVLTDSLRARRAALRPAHAQPTLSHTPPASLAVAAVIFTIQFTDVLIHTSVSFTGPSGFAWWIPFTPAFTELPHLPCIACGRAGALLQSHSQFNSQMCSSTPQFHSQALRALRGFLLCIPFTPAFTELLHLSCIARRRAAALLQSHSQFNSQMCSITPPLVAPPSSVVKCFWGVFVRGFEVLFLSSVCVSVSGVLFSVGVCVCATC